MQICDVELDIKGNFDTMSAARILEQWSSIKELLDEGKFEGREEWAEDGFNYHDGRIQKVWWSAAWIPFAEDSCANLKCIDMQPKTNGVVGQIMAMEFQDAQGPFSTSFDSFRDYLLAHWECLQKGWYGIDDEGLLSIEVPFEDKRSW